MRRVIRLGYQPKAVKPGSEVVLTDRQREEIVTRLRAGHTRQRIADDLQVSRWTVGQVASALRRAA